MVREIYRPLRLRRGFQSTMRTAENNWGGQPLAYTGLYWTPDEIAKISQFINVDRGAIGGRQLLHPGLLAEARQEAPLPLGREAAPLGHHKYGFFAQEWTTGPAVEARGPFRTQLIAGYGVVIIMMPNGSTYYYLGEGPYEWAAAVTESMLHLEPPIQQAETGP